MPHGKIGAIRRALRGPAVCCPGIVRVVCCVCVERRIKAAVWVGSEMRKLWGALTSAVSSDSRRSCADSQNGSPLELWHGSRRTNRHRGPGARWYHMPCGGAGLRRRGRERGRETERVCAVQPWAPQQAGGCSSRRSGSGGNMVWRAAAPAAAVSRKAAGVDGSVSTRRVSLFDRAEPRAETESSRIDP